MTSSNQFRYHPEEYQKLSLKYHLAELEKRGIIEKVTKETDWDSAMVVNKIRLCLDPQPLNKALKRYHYPIPMIEKVLPDLANARCLLSWNAKLVTLDHDLSVLSTPPFGHCVWRGAFPPISVRYKSSYGIRSNPWRRYLATPRLST